MPSRSEAGVDLSQMKDWRGAVCSSGRPQYATACSTSAATRRGGNAGGHAATLALRAAAQHGTLLTVQPQYATGCSTSGAPDRRNGGKQIGGKEASRQTERRQATGQEKTEPEAQHSSFNSALGAPLVFLCRGSMHVQHTPPVAHLGCRSCRQTGRGQCGKQPGSRQPT